MGGFGSACSPWAWRRKRRLRLLPEQLPGQWLRSDSVRLQGCSAGAGELGGKRTERGGFGVHGDLLCRGRECGFRWRMRVGRLDVVLFLPGWAMATSLIGDAFLSWPAQSRNSGHVVSQERLLSTRAPSLDWPFPLGQKNARMAFPLINPSIWPQSTSLRDALPLMDSTR